MKRIAAFLKSIFFRDVPTVISALIISTALAASIVSASTTISNDITTSGQLSVEGTSTLMGNVGISTTASTSNALSVAGDTYLGGDVTATGTLNVSGAGTSTINGVLDGHYYQHCTSISSAVPQTTLVVGNTFTKISFSPSQSYLRYDPDGNYNSADSSIIVPSWAHSMQIWGHLDFPNEDVGYTAGLSFFRNGASTNEAYYDSENYILPGFSDRTVYTSSPIIPANPGDVWTIAAEQNAVPSMSIDGDSSFWLGACFYP